jgi:periodic tryptophan protein 1
MKVCWQSFSYFISPQDFAALEVHVYDQRKGSLYVHHDIPLPSYPLCLAHGQVSSSGTVGNFCAVGTFAPGIEIWNLDVLNALEPSCILGGDDTTIADDLMRQQMMSEAGHRPPKQTRRPNDGALRPGSHTDAVMALSWNQMHRQVIASGSADNTVKIWDVTQAGLDANGKCCAGTFSHHKDKVQSVVWHPKEATLLATGSYDRTVALLDARNGGSNVKSIKITGDCEALAWDPCHPEYLTVAAEDGTISCFDVRKFETSKPLWSFVANEFGGVSDFSYNPVIPGLMATCSTDKTVTLWDTCSQNGVPTANVVPRPCGSKDMCSGKLFSVAFYPSSPWLVGSAGSGNMLALWDLSGEEALRKRFRDRHESKEVSAESTETIAEEVDEKSKQQDAESKQKDLDAMMAPKDDAAMDTVEQTSSKKKKNKGKSKAHKK